MPKVPKRPVAMAAD